jgi:hypothetical protein
VQSFEPQDFEGLDPQDLAEEEDFTKQIEERRKARETFTHTRQVRTEADLLPLAKMHVFCISPCPVLGGLHGCLVYPRNTCNFA